MKWQSGVAFKFRDDQYRDDAMEIARNRAFFELAKSLVSDREYRITFTEEVVDLLDGLKECRVNISIEAP